MVCIRPLLPSLNPIGFSRRVQFTSVVVDPGVGTARKALFAEAGGQRFVAPDNGVLSQVFDREDYRAWSVDSERFALKPTSNTFHGRDLFAPVAAHAAAGRASEDFGEPLDRPLQLPPTAPEEIAPGRWRGRGARDRPLWQCRNQLPGRNAPVRGAWVSTIKQETS